MKLLRGEALARAIAEQDPKARDAFVDAMLGLGAPPLPAPTPRAPDVRTTETEAGRFIGFVPSGVSAIADAVIQTRIGPGDTFCDIGAGTGRVAMLVHLLTGARTVGIEHDAALVAIAEEGARRHRLEGVSFLKEDVRRAELSGYDVFYMYLPFVGKPLRDVLGRLQAVGQARPIRVATLGVLLRDRAFRALAPDSLWLDAYDTQRAVDGHPPVEDALPSLTTVARELHLAPGAPGVRA